MHQANEYYSLGVDENIDDVHVTITKFIIFYIIGETGVQWSTFVNFDCLLVKYSFFIKCMHVIFTLKFRLHLVKNNKYVYFFYIF